MSIKIASVPKISIISCLYSGFQFFPHSRIQTRRPASTCVEQRNRKPLITAGSFAIDYRLQFDRVTGNKRAKKKKILQISTNLNAGFPLTLTCLMVRLLSVMNATYISENRKIFLTFFPTLS